MDKTVWEFYLAHECSDFFKNAVPVMVDERRAMLPISDTERSIQETASVIPAIVASRGTLGIGDIINMASKYLQYLMHAICAHILKWVRFAVPAVPVGH